MIGLLQRVSEARVHIDSESVAEIGTGILVLVGVERHDAETEADRLMERLLGYRVFSDAEGRMNLSLRDINGGSLLTLIAECDDIPGSGPRLECQEPNCCSSCRGLPSTRP